MYKIIGADQNEYGPITAEQVRQWMAEGRLNALSKIQVDGSGQWKLLREMPEFASLVPSPPAISLEAPSPSSPVVGGSAAPPVNNPLAGWALGTGIASLACCPLGILSLAGIVLGAVALAQIKQNPKQGGRALAIGGIVLGCISLLLAVIFWGICFLRTNADVSSPFFR
jgi:hypothetical protein